jgi:hypothetical protein
MYLDLRPELVAGKEGYQPEAERFCGKRIDPLR